MLGNLELLHKLCFPEKPWAASDFAELKKSGCEIMCSENGFIVWRTVLDEAEIITIGVNPDSRGTGIAKTILTLAQMDVKQSGVKKIFLEVSKNNKPAINLYSGLGYISVGIRPKYYDGVDAIIMEKML